MPGWGLGENATMAVSFGPVQEHNLSGLDGGVDIFFQVERTVFWDPGSIPHRDSPFHK